MDDRRLSTEWSDLRGAGQVPDKGKGTTADRIERDKDRKRPRYPTEDRRAGRVIGPTLSAGLVDRLREICQAAGYSKGGQGQIASPVIEDMLWYAVDAYDAGELRQTTETTRRRLEAAES